MRQIGLILPIAAVALTVSLAAGRWGQAAGQPSPSAVQKPHPELPDTEADTCRACHEGAAEGEVVHGPVAAGLCVSCHVFSGTGDDTAVALAAGATSSQTLPLCASCHEDVAAALEAAHVHGPAAYGDCLSCHAPHQSPNRSLLTTGGVAGCTGCHEDVGESLTQRSKHAPAAADCALCHDPHGGPRAGLLRDAVNDLCLACHLGGAWGQPAAGPVLFGRPVADPLHGLLSPDARIALDPQRMRGHPTFRHPVAGVQDPLDETRPLTCISCHEPHGTEGLWLLRFGGDNPDLSCVTCHKW